MSAKLAAVADTRFRESVETSVRMWNMRKFQAEVSDSSVKLRSDCGNMIKFHNQETGS